MEDQTLCDTGSSSRNPLDIPEVVENIMHFLHSRDLFNCRLVNKIWENEARNELGIKFTMKLSNVPRDLRTTLDPINDVGYFNYLQLNGEHLNTDGPQSTPPMIRNLYIQKYAILQTALFVSIGPFIQRLTYVCCEDFRFRSLDIIIKNCTNLEYLEFSTWCEYSQRNSVVTSTQDVMQQLQLESTMLLKLKTLIMRFTRYVPIMETDYVRLISILLERAPNLRQLEFPCARRRRPVPVPNAIVLCLLQFTPSMTELKSLILEYIFPSVNHFTNPQLIKILSCTNFQLNDLVLNEELVRILPTLGTYQSKLAYFTTTLRRFNWTAFRSTINSQQFQMGQEMLRIKLLDFQNRTHSNQYEITVMNTFGGNEKMVVLHGFRSCQTITTYFWNNLQHLLNQDPLIAQTISKLELPNVPGFDMDDVQFLVHFPGLVCLEFWPISLDVFTSVFGLLPQLRELSVHFNIYFYPLQLVESAITGISMADCYSHYTNREISVDSSGKMVVTNAPVSARQVVGCICGLSNLRVLEIWSTKEPGRETFLSELAVVNCFAKLGSLIRLVIPYWGTEEALQFLRDANPAIDMELVRPEN